MAKVSFNDETGEWIADLELGDAVADGEDYELLFSISEKKLPMLEETGITWYKVGKVVEGGADPIIVIDEGRYPLSSGFNHFR